MCLRHRTTFEGDDRCLLPLLRRERARMVSELSKDPRQSGYTLVEMLLVIGLLVLIAALAAPTFTDNKESKLDVATADVAGAIRFAQSEAIRTGVPHGVNADFFTKRIKIYRLPVATPIYDVYDPLTKQLYDLDFSVGQSDVTIGSIYFKFENFFFPTSFLGFSGGTGLPKYNDSGTIRMLETAFVRLDYMGAQRTINVAPMTGRVTVQ